MAEPCPECGFSYDSVSPGGAPDAIRAFGRRYRAPLARLLAGEDEGVLRVRPEPAVWSALEYACHVRDVLSVYRERVTLVQAEDEPVLEPMGRDERPARDRYNEQDPAVVVDELAAAADALAADLASLDDAAWARTGIHQYPEPAPRSLVWMAANVVHEGNHHLLDIGRVLRTVRERSRS